MIGEADQTAKFSGGIYMNAGPARIPSFHTGLLGYCDKFDVPLEVEVNSSRSAYIMAKDGTRIRQRTAVNDLRGHIAELACQGAESRVARHRDQRGRQGQAAAVPQASTATLSPMAASREPSGRASAMRPARA